MVMDGYQLQGRVITAGRLQPTSPQSVRSDDGGVTMTTDKLLLMGNNDLSRVITFSRGCETRNGNRYLWGGTHRS